MFIVKLLVLLQIGHCYASRSFFSKDRKQVEKTETISLEELIENERSALTSTNSTKLTLETFLQWKKKKLMEKKKAKEKEEEKKRLNFKAGHHIGVICNIQQTDYLHFLFCT